MARPNRVSKRDSIYRSVSRFCDDHTWLENDGFKADFLERLYDFAEFSGIELLEWNIMDDKFDLLFYVPPVPKQFWIDENAEPDSYANGMRPPEKRVPLWPPLIKYPKGPLPQPLRAPVDFLPDDSEMLVRLTALYADEDRAKAKIAHWKWLRSRGRSEEADEEKTRYCLRMYNVSQFMKNVNEWVAREVKQRFNHRGHVFAERFHSAVVSTKPAAMQLASLDLNYEAYRSTAVNRNETYYWSSFGRAVSGGRHSDDCRQSLIKIWSPAMSGNTIACSKDSSKTWTMIRERIISDFAAPVNLTPEAKSEVLSGNRAVPPEVLIKLDARPLSRAYYIGCDRGFEKEIDDFLPQGFPRPGFRAFRMLVKMVAWPPAS